MAITEAKFRAYHDIQKSSKKKLDDQEIIKIALEEYDVNLRKVDIEAIKKNWQSLMWKYEH